VASPGRRLFRGTAPWSATFPLASVAAAALLAALPAGAAGLLPADTADAPDATDSRSLPAELTFDDAVRIARERSPDRRIAEAAVAGVRAQVKTAGALPNPVAGFMAGFSSGCTDPGCNLPVFSATLGDQGALSTVVTGQRALAVDAALQSLAAAEALQQDVGRSLDFQVKQQFVATSIAWRGHEFARKESATSEQAVQLGRKRLAAGAITPSDLARLQVLHVQIQQVVDRTAIAFEQARAALGRLLGARGDPVRFTVAPGPTMTATPPPPLDAATLEGLLAEARRLRPDLAAARAQVEAARTQAALARRQVIPAFQLQAQYQQQGSASGGWFTPPTTSFGLSVPLPVLYQQQGQIGAADAGVVAAEAGLARVEAQVLADVTDAFAAYEGQRRAAQRAERELVVLSREAQGLVEGEYAQGTASLIDYLDARRSRLLTESEFLQTLGSFWEAVFQLEQAVGAAYVP
jgi:outer membrane protein, heavy metal efflux system